MARLGWIDGGYFDCVSVLGRRERFGYFGLAVGLEPGMRKRWRRCRCREWCCLEFFEGVVRPGGAFLKWELLLPSRV